MKVIAILLLICLNGCLHKVINKGYYDGLDSIKVKQKVQFTVYELNRKILDTTIYVGHNTDSTRHGSFNRWYNTYGRGISGERSNYYCDSIRRAYDSLYRLEMVP